MLLSSQWFPTSNFTTISSNIFEELFHLSTTLLAKFISVTARFSMKVSLYFNSIHIQIIKFDNNQKFHKYSEPQRLKFKIFEKYFICHPEVASSCILEYNCQISSRCMQFLTNWIMQDLTAHQFIHIALPYMQEPKIMRCFTNLKQKDSSLKPIENHNTTLLCITSEV